jgi:DNA-binding beta-propeller fold protein YncE
MNLLSTLKLGFLILLCCNKVFGQSMELLNSFSGHLAPKSIVHNGHGIFFAQNMMYEHTISVFDRENGLVKTISDSIRLSDFGYKRFKDTVIGAPCEAATTHNGRFFWVANYAMYGTGFDSIADDECVPNGGYDSSFVFKISSKTLEIKNAIKVGCVPKFLQVYKDSLLLVSNWCSGNVSVISLITEKVIRDYDVKMYPRGIAFDPASETAYIAQMGTYEIAKINLSTHIFDSIVIPGRSPRHLCIDTENRLLYASLNGSGLVAKIDLETDSTIATVATGRAPRSMVLSADGKYLYVVNYYSNNFSKVRTSDFKVLESKTTEPKPIGITFDDETKNVWVSCYEGYVQVFKDNFYGVDSLYEQTPSAAYGLVLGSFRQKQNADKLLAMLKTKAIAATIIEEKNKYRVVFCGFASIEEALKAKEENADFKKAWVLKCE